METGITPLLGAQAVQEMDLISVNFENIAALENSLSARAGITKENFISKFPSLFRRELGCIEGMLHLEMDPSSAPVQMALCRVPLALREPLKTELERLEEESPVALPEFIFPPFHCQCFLSSTGVLEWFN